VDVHSWVTLSQKFHNPADKKADRIIYTFSMLADSAIYAFEMIRQNGTKVVGISKEREQAKRELNEALAAGKTAALGEEQSKDGSLNSPRSAAFAILMFSCQSSQLSLETLGPRRQSRSTSLISLLSSMMRTKTSYGLLYLAPICNAMEDPLLRKSRQARVTRTFL
jgi:hypothetical protein